MERRRSHEDERTETSDDTAIDTEAMIPTRIANAAGDEGHTPGLGARGGDAMSRMTNDHTSAGGGTTRGTETRGGGGTVLKSAPADVTMTRSTPDAVTVTGVLDATHKIVATHKKNALGGARLLLNGAIGTAVTMTAALGPTAEVRMAGTQGTAMRTRMGGAMVASRLLQRMRTGLQN